MQMFERHVGQQWAFKADGFAGRRVEPEIGRRIARRLIRVLVEPAERLPHCRGRLTVVVGQDRGVTFVAPQRVAEFGVFDVLAKFGERLRVPARPAVGVVEHGQKVVGDVIALFAFDGRLCLPVRAAGVMNLLLAPSGAFSRFADERSEPRAGLCHNAL